MSHYMQSLQLPNRILLGAGPSNIHPRILQAMLTPMLGHLDPDFWPVLDDIREMLSLVFHTSTKGTFPLPATGTAAMESSFCNMVEPGDSVVIAVNGFFSDRMTDIASRCGAEVHRIDVPWGSPVLPEHIDQACRSVGTVKAVGVVHAATSTGVLSPIKDIAEVVHQHNAVIIVDAVTSLGGLEFRMDDWELDVCYSASQKCLGAPSGLAPISFGPRALEVLKNRQTPVQSFYLDMSNVEAYWDETKRYHHTTPILMMYAFREALRMMLEEGMEKRWERHARNAASLRAGLEALGLELFADEGYRLNPLTTIAIPGGVDGAAVQRQLYKNYEIEIGGGLGELAGKIWRIGLMGESCQASNVLAVLSALEHILPQQGYDLTHGDGVAAAQKVLAA